MHGIPTTAKKTTLNGIKKKSKFYTVMYGYFVDIVKVLTELGREKYGQQ